MRLKMSYINRGILLNDFKRFGWISAGYLLGMLLSVPLRILMLHSQVERTGVLNDRFAYLHVFQFNSPLQLILLILVPILTGLWLFQYLQDGKAADMVHALPVKRETLYNTHILAGMIFLFVPLLITALASWALIAGLGITQAGGLNILAWLVFGLLFNLLFFMTSVATAMFTGMSTVQAVLSLILLLLPSGLAMLLLYNFKMYAYGFAFDHYYEGTQYAPLLRITNISSIQSGEIIAYLLACIALYLVGRYLYRRRQLETAGDAITFGVLRPVFKYGATFCFMMLAGSYFFSAQNNSMAWTYFGYLIGSLAAYFLCEILLNKSLYVFQWKAVKGYGIFSLVIVLLIAWLHFGLGGYEQKTPELSQIGSVYLANYFIHEQVNTSPVASQLYQPAPIGMAQIQTDNTTYVPLELPLPLFKDANNIAAIYALHQKLIDNQAKEKTADLIDGKGTARFYKTPLCLVYNLKNGAHIYRQYTVRLSNYTQQLKPLYESSEYKYLHNTILEVNPAEIKVMDIAAEQTNRSVRLVDPKLIRQAVAALQSDIGQQTFEETISERPGWAHIRILLESNRTADLEWKKSYVNFDQWLKSIGEYNNARLTPQDDIQYAVILKRTGDSGDSTESISNYYRLLEQQPLALEYRPDCLKVSNPEKLETCLRQYTSPFQQPYATSGQQSYPVVFILKAGGTCVGVFTEADAPAFVKEHFTGQKSGL